MSSKDEYNINFKANDSFSLARLIEESLTKI